MIAKLRKLIKKDISISRVYAAYKRRQRRHAYTNKFVLKTKKNLVKFERLLIDKTPKLKLKDKGSEDLNSLMKFQSENSKSDFVIIDTLGEKTPKTPSPNKKARKILKKRNEETPYRRTEINIPDYVYNEDDELFSSVIQAIT